MHDIKFNQGDPKLTSPLQAKIWKTSDENDDYASKYDQFKNYEVPDFKMK